jgi:hypothetical protein
MVKHIHIQVSNEDHERLKKQKGSKKWREVLEKGIESLDER